jgi:peptidoglycan-associated lipoprotein
MTPKPRLLLPLFLAGLATAANAQIAFPRLPVIVPLGGSQQQPPPPPPPGGPGASGPVVQGALAAAAGSDTVYFSPRGATLDANATRTLAAQARWLIANPFVNVRLEGHGGPQDSRDYALAIGDKRANAVRDYLAMLGVAPQRITVLSWGKERAGSVRIGPTIVAAGPRVVTVIQ